MWQPLILNNLPKTVDQSTLLISSPNWVNQCYSFTSNFKRWQDNTGTFTEDLIDIIGSDPNFFNHCFYLIVPLPELCKELEVTITIDRNETIPTATE